MSKIVKHYETGQLIELDRDDVPAGSFVYGQEAKIEAMDAPAHVWIVGTVCAHAQPDGSLVDVVCGHFLRSLEDDARATAIDLVRGGHRVVLVRPAVEIEKGTQVKIRPGTELSYVEAGDESAEWTSAVEGDLDDWEIPAPTYEVVDVCVGPDGTIYRLTDGVYDVSVRTTSARPESACFEVVR